MLLNQRDQSEKATYYMIQMILHAKKAKSIESKMLSGSQRF